MTAVFTKEIRADLYSTSARQSCVRKQWQECALMYGQHALCTAMLPGFSQNYVFLTRLDPSVRQKHIAIVLK